MVASGELKAPVAISLDHLDDGASAEGAILNALASSAAGATWVSIQVGGGAAAGSALELSQTCVACGGRQSAGSLERVMTRDAPVKAGPPSAP